MPVGLKAIYPRTHLGVDVATVPGQVERALMLYGLAVGARMAQYPAQIPPISSNPRRRPYRRTGDYGRFWSSPGAVRVTGNSVTLVNRVQHNGRSYGVYVGGPVPGEGAGKRQAKIMARRGWPNISAVAREEARKFRPILNRAIVGRAV